MLSHTFLRQSLLVLHFIGLAFGFGGATVADFSFLRSIRRGDRVTPETVSWMRSFSKVVWVGIGILSISGLGLFMMDPSKYLHSPGFLAKMVVVAILIVNGFFLNSYVVARMTTFNFSEKYTRSDAAWKVRKLSMIFGAISAVSWYSALIIAEFKDSFSASFYLYMALYLVALGCAVAGSIGLEAILNRRATIAVNQPKQPTIDQLAYGRTPEPIQAAPANTQQTDKTIPEPGLNVPAQETNQPKPG